ncbi:MAG: deoxyribodipyrimidine photo-lyase/cryptochrome family protein [Flavobacteriaceae bacterium]
MKEPINIFWFKRDLRLLDNEPLNNAVSQKEKLLLIYCFEPSLKKNKHYTSRHWNFIKESINDLNIYLKNIDTHIHTYNKEFTDVLKEIQDKFLVKKIFSHKETGLNITFERDILLKEYCQENSIQWEEEINNGVFRGLKNRKNWIKKWRDHMISPVVLFKGEKNDFINIKKNQNLKVKNSKILQKGGSSSGIKYLDSFLDTRHTKYQNNISKPEASRTSCSRLSPYMSWGNISTRYAWQRAKEQIQNGKSKFQLNGFTSRLRWQAHFIQKFEMECQMEFRSVNKGYQNLVKPINKKFISAWQKGKTGYPLVDASMRCVVETGYLNFRMRALLVSFLTHHLWQPWQSGVIHLARNFLDFEPGIHYSQFQMQAGETGINMIRIYNPTKNAKEHDKDGIFIKKWIPELKKIPTPLLFEPWKMSLIDQETYDYKIGKDYPNPIVDISETYKYAASKLWRIKSNPKVKEESSRILQKHTNTNRKAFDD